MIVYKKYMKRKLTNIVLQILIPAICFTTPIYADVGYMPEEGGLLLTDTQTNAVEMTSESVHVTISENDGLFEPHNEYLDSYFAHVDATFSLTNLTQNSVNISSYFPFLASSYISEGFLTQQSGNIKNIKIIVDGSETAYSVENLLQKNASGGDVLYYSAVFPLDFDPASTKKIIITYDQNLQNRPHSFDIGYDYTMFTGSSWAGSIGSGEVKVDFGEYKLHDEKIVTGNDNFQLINGQLVWEFTNLEPTGEDNIRLSFDPREIGLWDTLPSYINSIYSSNNIADVKFIQMETVNETTQENWRTTNGKVVNLFDYDNSEYGWVFPVENKDISNEYVTINFNSDYTITTLKILAGVWERYSERYDLLDHPKEINIEYSDGTIQNVALEDVVSEYQTIDLLDIPTSSLTLHFGEYYKNVSGVDDVFGIGRIAFEGVKEVENNIPTQNIPTASITQASTSQDANNTLLYVSLASLIGLGVIVSVVVFKNNHVKVNEAQKDDQIGSKIDSEH